MLLLRATVIASTRGKIFLATQHISISSSTIKNRFPWAYVRDKFKGFLLTPLCVPKDIKFFDGSSSAPSTVTHLQRCDMQVSQPWERVYQHHLVPWRTSIIVPGSQAGKQPMVTTGISTQMRNTHMCWMDWDPGE